MDTFTFTVALILMMMAVQFQQNWLVFSVVAIMILTMRSITATIVLLVTTGVVYVARNSLEPYWPFVFFGLIILALLMGGGSGGEQQPEYYSPDMYGGLMGGGGGG